MSGLKILPVPAVAIVLSSLCHGAVLEGLDEQARYQRALELYGAPVIEIPRVEGPVEVDGDISEPAWQHAERVAVAWQSSPISNLRSKVETTALIMEDGETLYVAFDARDPNPELIRAHLRQRDQLFSDDYVGFGVDTEGDGARTFEFFSNPIGVQGDALADQQSGEDFSFDAIWDLAARITDRGFEVEFAVPLSQIRFPKREGAQQWKVFFTRTHWRDQRYQAFQYPFDPNNACFSCQHQPATGLTGVKPGRQLQIIPSLTGNTLRTRDPVRQTGDVRAEELELGVDDFRWGIAPNVTLNATVNPDFSNIEADIAQSAVNTSFVLFFPERRPFFLEGRDFFSTQMNLVNTRNISDPSYGGKVTGKVGRNVFGVMAAEDRVTNVLLPASQGSSTRQLEQDNRATVARYRRDFRDSSHVGVLVTDRRGDDYANRVVGFDGRYRISSSDTLTAQFARSRSENPLQLRNQFGLAPSSEDSALEVRYNHWGQRWLWGASHRDFGEAFRADTGFINQTDYESSNAFFGRGWRGRSGEFFSNRTIQLQAGRSITKSTGERLRDGFGLFASASLPRDTWVNFAYFDQRQAFAGVDFDLAFASLAMRSRAVDGLIYAAFIQIGDAIDFANVRAGDRQSINQQIDYNLNEHVLLRLNHTYQTLDVSGGELFRQHLTDFRVTYQFNLESALLVSLIHEDTRRDVGLFDSPVDERSRRFEAQILYSYRLNPESVFFAGYSTAGIGNDQFSGLRQTNDTLFMKLTYAWQL